MRARDQWRTFATSARTVSSALKSVISGRGRGSRTVLVPGHFAPDFTLPGTDGQAYRLRDFRARTPVVLAWFPKAFTGGCTVECRSIQSSREELDRQGVRYFAVSADDLETNRQFAASLGLDYPILSDADGSVARAYGVMGSTGFPSRWTFYIDRDGRIVEIDKGVKASSHGRTIAARIAELGLGGPNPNI